MPDLQGLSSNQPLASWDGGLRYTLIGTARTFLNQDRTKSLPPLITQYDRTFGVRSALHSPYGHPRAAVPQYGSHIILETRSPLDKVARRKSLWLAYGHYTCGGNR